jgi:hypothetical protein
MTVERYSLSPNSISAIFNYLKEQPYVSVRGLFDLLDVDLQKYSVEVKEPVNAVIKPAKKRNPPRKKKIEGSEKI